MIKHIDESLFKEEVKNIEGVSLVEFYATWCGPCMRLAPILEEIGNSKLNYNILRVDVDKNHNISNELQIDTIPTICVYKDGNLMEKQIGFKNKDEIIKLIKKYK